MASWDRNWRNGTLKTYDQNYMLDAIGRLNDPQVRLELTNSGFLRPDGGWNYGSAADAAGAVNAWATSNGLQPYQGAASPASPAGVSFGSGNAWDATYQAAPEAARANLVREDPNQPESITVKDNNPTPVVAEAKVDTATPVTNPQVMGEFTTGNTAAWQGADYKLPSGEVLPGWASFALEVGGQQIKIPGIYDPGSATGGNPQPIFMNGSYPETAVQRLQRRLLDARNRGENINDPNVMYREMARVRDDALVALGLSPNDPQLSAKLRAGTGFVHLDRFARGANGETGYTAAPGTQTPSTPAAPGAGGGDNGGGAGGGAGESDGQYARNTAYASDPDAREDYVLRALGIDPNNGGLYLNSILRTIAPALTNFIQLQGISGNVNEGPQQNTEQNLQKFAGWLNGPEGMGGLRNWAQEQMRGVAGPSQGPAGLRDMSDANAQINTLGKLLETSMFGVNPILTQAYADYFDRGRRGYRDYNIGQMGKGAITNPIDWLLGSEWGDLING